MKKFVLRLGIVIGALLCVVFGVGTFLPVSHTASVTRVIAAPPDEVWGVVADVQSYPEWRPDVDSIEILNLPGAPRAWIEHGPGGTLPFAAEIDAPPRRLVTRIDTDDLPFGGKWTTTLGPVEGGTEVTIREDGEVKSALYRFVSRFVIGHDRTIRTYLDALDVRMGAE